MLFITDFAFVVVAIISVYMLLIEYYYKSEFNRNKTTAYLPNEGRV